MFRLVRYSPMYGTPCTGWWVNKVGRGLMMFKAVALFSDLRVPEPLDAGCGAGSTLCTLLFFEACAIRGGMAHYWRMKHSSCNDRPLTRAGKTKLARIK